ITPQKQPGMDQREQEQSGASGEQIKALMQQVADLKLKIERQKFEYEQMLQRNEEQYSAKEKELLAKAQRDGSDTDKEREKQLSEKYRQFDRALREKTEAYEKQLDENDRAFKAFKQETQAKETTLRQLIATKEIEAQQKLEKEKKALNDELAAIKTSAEQLRLYMIKLKEELKVKSAVVEEKDEQLDLLNKKLALYSGEDIPNQQKLAGIASRDLEISRKENARLQQELDNLNVLLSKEKEGYEAELAQQKKIMEELRRKSAEDSEKRLISLEEKYEKKIFALTEEKDAIRRNAAMEREKALASQQQEMSAQTGNVSQEWEKKIKLIEARYSKQLRALEEEKEKAARESESKLRELSDKLRAKVAEDEQIKVKLGSFRSNQVGLLEEMLISKATLMLKLPQNFRGAEKEKAQIYFERAMTGIIAKDYARAKSDLEQVISMEPDNQITIDIMQSLDFLLKRI
ncbi:MAG: hypothetical protein PHO30_01715, partial [Candidatus Omnitrophica bacterium]|nr:hypothetical protein [Candidatus Omnitrophota bacterium]